MTKRKEEMSSDYRKGGYLKVGRNILKAFFSASQEQRRLAGVLLCVQTFAYFSDGQVCMNDRTVYCRAGEWITSYTEIAGLTGVDRRMAKKYLSNLEERGFLHVHTLGNYKRIALNTFIPEENQTKPDPSSAVSNGSVKEGEVSGFWTQVNTFYQSSNKGKKWIN